MEKVINTKEERIFLDSLKDIVKSARKFAYNSINLAQLRQNWLIGQNLVIQEQKGKSRAEYGKHIIEIASKELTEEYGKGFSERSLWKFKQFYLTFNDLQILPTVSAESTPLLSWSHYERLMQNFLLELGKGFSFVARQQLIRTETSEFYIDLVFYNYLLNCFVIIELKNHAITHQDIGQLDMYVKLYDDFMKGEHDNPTIGILLCTETDKTIARYSVLNDNKQLFASQYMNYLPSEEELKQVLEQQKEIFLSMKNK